MSKHVPRRRLETVTTVGAAAQVFGAVLLVVGSMVPIGQLVVGTSLQDVDWLMFVIVGGFGFALYLFGRALGRRFQGGRALGDGYQAAGETIDRTREYIADGGGGDAGD